MSSPKITDRGVEWDEASLLTLRQSFLNARNRAQQKVSEQQRQVDRVDAMLERVRSGQPVIVPMPPRTEHNQAAPS